MKPESGGLLVSVAPQPGTMEGDESSASISRQICCNTLVGWNEQGDLVLNEKGEGEADEADVTALYARAQSLYGQAEAKR